MHQCLGFVTVTHAVVALAYFVLVPLLDPALGGVLTADFAFYGASMVIIHG